MEQDPLSSINLSDDFMRNLIIQQQSSPADYTIDPRIIKYKFNLSSITHIIDTPIMKKLLQKIKGVKDVLGNFQMILNTEQRIIYRQRQGSNAEIGNQFILNKLISIIDAYKQEIIPKMNILPIFLSINRNFQQQIKHGNRIIYEEENQKVIIWDQEIKGEQKQITIKAEKVEKKQSSTNLLKPHKNQIKQSNTKLNTRNENFKAIIGTYHKTVRINFDKKQIRFGQLDKVTSQFQGIKGQIKGEQFLMSIGRWKGEDPIEIITIFYIPEEQPFIIYKQYTMKTLSKSTVWFIQEGLIKYYHEKQ